MSADLTTPAEADAFQAMVSPHLVTMRRLAARLTSDDASDGVVAGALRDAWLHRGRDDDDGARLGWLLRLVAERGRRRNRWGRRSDAPSRESELIDLSADVIELDLDPRQDLDADIARLPWRQRVAIELTYILGLEAEVCATVLRCDEAALSSLLVEARRELLGGAQQVEL